MGQNYFYGQADEAQSSRYNCSTQRHTGVDNYRHCCASGPKYPYYWIGKVSKPNPRNEKNPQSQESDSITHRDWCTLNYLGVYKGREWEVESSRYFWKRTVISRPWYCPYLEESFTCLSCGITAENSQKKNWRGSHHNNNNNKKKKKKKNIFI